MLRVGSDASRTGRTMASARSKRKGLVHYRSDLLAWLAKFRYALGLQSFATRFACKVSLRAWLAKNFTFNSH